MENVAQPSQAVEHKPWQFKPGICANPKGRPKKSQALRELERVTREQATAVLEKLAGPALRVLQKALDSKDPQLAVRAAIDVLDRTQGKAIQKIEAGITNETNVIVSVQDLQIAARKVLASAAIDVEAREVTE